MAKKKHPSWPAWRYGPNGEKAVFQGPEEVPKGWVNNPLKFQKGYVDPTDPKPAPPAKQTIPMTRKDIKEALTAGGVPFAASDSTENLYAVLVDRLLSVCKEQNIAAPANVDAPTLLGLVMKA